MRYRPSCSSCLLLPITLSIVAPTSDARAAQGPGGAPAEAAAFENEHLRFVVGADGTSLHFIDRRTKTDWRAAGPPVPLAFVQIGPDQVPVSAASLDGENLRLQFAGRAVATLRIKPLARHVVIRVVSLEGAGVERFAFVDVPLGLKGVPGEPFAACVLARNLQTNVEEIPQPMSRLRAMCYRRFGFAGAEAALVGCPAGELREVLKEAVLAAPDLPHSTVGGPWAMEGPDNRGSYLFNYTNLTEKTVDEWIHLARAAGINQIDFHGGGSFRFGDCRPNPDLYPRGQASLKAVIDRLHAAGIKAGLHTYAFFIDKRCPWVTPVPDPRLGKDAVFTLAADLSPDAKTVPVLESTQHMSNVTDFFIRNSVTLQIDDELIVYRQIVRQPPYAFTDCQRGACGTKAAAHEAGAKVHHLKECFGLFAPDGDSTLLAEVAARTADAFNACGFDMMYLDALDGEDVLGGGENGWHYGSRFVFEICKRLQKPAIMEMSTFHHHLWFVRSRMGAWDHPNRGHKRFVDIHCRANAGLERQFLPGHLGWWAIRTWTGHQNEPTFADDVEYLLCKCLGHDVGFSIAAGLDPASFRGNPLYPRMAALMRQYEELRHARAVDDETLAALREPGKEFRLVRQADGPWRFRPVAGLPHKVGGLDDPSASWAVENPFAPQTPRLRIEALLSAEPYDSPEARVLTDFGDLDRYTVRAAAPGVTCELAAVAEPVKVGPRSAKLTAARGSDPASGAWARVGRVFEPTLDMKGHEAIGLWVHGDGGGQVLNFQWASPPELVTRGLGEHYVVVDFTGWRYFALVELDGGDHGRYDWPYGGAYDVYRENVDEGNLKTFDLWCGHLPAGRPTTCLISPIRCLPLVKARIKNPALTVNGQTVVFPVEMESGCCLEAGPGAEARLYGPGGELRAEVRPQGDTIQLRAGRNDVRFACEPPPRVQPRAKVTVFCEGEPIGRPR